MKTVLSALLVLCVSVALRAQEEDPSMLEPGLQEEIENSPARVLTIGIRPGPSWISNGMRVALVATSGESKVRPISRLTE